MFLSSAMPRLLGVIAVLLGVVVTSSRLHLVSGKYLLHLVMKRRQMAHMSVGTGIYNNIDSGPLFTNSKPIS